MRGRECVLIEPLATGCLPSMVPSSVVRCCLGQGWCRGYQEGGYGQEKYLHRKAANNQKAKMDVMPTPKLKPHANPCSQAIVSGGSGPPPCGPSITAPNNAERHTYELCRQLGQEEQNATRQ